MGTENGRDMATQVIRKAIGNSPDAREIELIGGLVRAHGRVTLLVPHAGMRDVCRRTLADAGLGVGVDVLTPAAWVSALWELSGDGRRIVEPAERRLLLARSIDEAASDPARPADAVALPRTTGSLAMLATAARLYQPFITEARSGSLTPSERAVVDVLERYACALDRLGAVEPSCAAVSLAAMGTGGVPGVHAVVARALDDRPEYLVRLLDACACRVPLLVLEDDGGACAGLSASRLQFAEISGPSARDAAHAELIFGASPSAAGATLAVAAPDPIAAFRALAPRLAARGLEAQLSARVPFEDTRAGQAFFMLQDLLRRMGEEEPSAWWPAPEVPDWIRSPFSGLSHAAPRISRMLDARLRKTRKLDAEGLMAELTSLESRELNRERKLAEEDGRDRRPIVAAAAPRALADGRPARALALMAEAASAASPHAFGAEGLAAREAELAALEEASVLMEAAHRLGVSEEQAVLALPGLATRLTADAVPSASTDPATRVLFISCEELARRAEGSFDAVVLIDMDADAYPLARRETPLDLLAAKLGCPGAKVPAVERHRIQVRRACGAGRRAVLAHTARDRQGDERYAALAYDELKAAFGDAAPPAPELPHEGALLSNLDVAAGRGAVFAEAKVPGTHVLPSGLERFLLPPTRSMGGTEVPRTLSASQIEAYLACPYSWLVGNRASTRRLDVGFGPIEMGNFVHDVMQRFHERLQEEGLRRVDAANLDACLEQMDLAYAEVRADHARGKYTHGKYAREERPRAIRGPLVALDELERDQLDAILPKLRDVVRHESDLMPGFIPAWFEYAFDKEGVAYAGRPLGGRIDRIDVAPAAGAPAGRVPERCERDRFVVIDYKNRASVVSLSCADPTMALEEGEGLDPAWLPGREADRAPKVQTLIYAQALARMGFGSAQGALYLGTRGPQVAGQVTDTLADTEPPSFPHDRVSGFPGVKPPRSRSALHDGTMALTELLDQVERAIAGELDRLEQGRIAPAPASDSCTYCPLTMCERRR